MGAASSRTMRRNCSPSPTSTARWSAELASKPPILRPSSPPFDRKTSQTLPLPAAALCIATASLMQKIDQAADDAGQQNERPEDLGAHFALNNLVALARMAAARRMGLPG